MIFRNGCENCTQTGHTLKDMTQEIKTLVLYFPVWKLYYENGHRLREHMKIIIFLFPPKKHNLPKYMAKKFSVNHLVFRANLK